MHGTKWTIEENNLLTEVYNKLSKTEIINLFNRSAQAINIQASKLKLRKIQNEYKQSDISPLLQESLEAYYWTGFILADGHISKSNRLHFGLATKDKDQVEKFAKFIKCNNIKISKKGNLHTVSAQDKYLIKQFKEKFNIQSDKTHIPPNLNWSIDAKLLLAMFVGYIDGDGSIVFQFKRKDCSIKFHVHANWLQILNKFHNFIQNYYKLNIAAPFIGKDGYLAWNICNNIVIKYLKEFVSNNNLPVLNRKWDRIC